MGVDRRGPRHLARVTPLDQFLAFLDVRADAGDASVITGQPAEFFDGDYLFGGVVIAQAIAAATLGVPEGRRLHSLHAYFLRPVAATAPVTYRIHPLREGRTFAARRLHAEQSGKAVFDMAYSLTADGDGYVYDLGGLGDVSPP